MTTAVETPSAVIDRVSLVLDAFDGPGRLNLAQIVRRTGLPRSSAHRMLERLVALRWLRRNGRDYELGMRLVELGSLAVHQDRLHRAAMPLLHDLHRATGLVVHLAILDGSDVVYLEKIGDRMMAAIPTRVGGRQPAHCAAVGKAMLAYREDTIKPTSSIWARARPGIRSARRRSCATNWPRFAPAGWRSTERSRLPDSVVSQHRSARPATPSRRCRCVAP